METKYRQQKELLYTGLSVRKSYPMNTREEEKRIKKDFDRKFKALLNVPPPEKDK